MFLYLFINQTKTTENNIYDISHIVALLERF